MPRKIKENKMNFLDLFSGIGGFHLGLERAGFTFDKVFNSEIDKYANSVYKYNFKESINVGSVTDVRGKDLPKINAITFGSPCQDFSLAGRRAGLEGNRSSLISEAIRLISECRPDFFIWENVKGTFSSNNGEDFWAIIKAFTNIGGYRLEWQLLNTRWFLPQNRERIYLVGHLGEGSGDEIFPIGGTNQSTEAIFIDESMRRKEKRLRFYNGYSSTLNTSQGGGNIPLIKIGAERGRYNNDGDIEQKLEIRSDEASNTLTGVEKDNRVISKKTIRRLTPTECERLQGFPDNWTKIGVNGLISDSQRYKMCGNAVTVDVVQAVGGKIYKCRENQAEKH